MYNNVIIFIIVLNQLESRCSFSGLRGMSDGGVYVSIEPLQ